MYSMSLSLSRPHPISAKEVKLLDEVSVLTKQGRAEAGGSHQGWPSTNLVPSLTPTMKQDLNTTPTESISSRSPTTRQSMFSATLPSAMYSGLTLIHVGLRSPRRYLDVRCLTTSPSELAVESLS